jgi:hypothetical protein
MSRDNLFLFTAPSQGAFMSLCTVVIHYTCIYLPLHIIAQGIKNEIHKSGLESWEFYENAVVAS